VKLDDVVARVPGIPGSANDSFVVSSEGTLTAIDRKILRFALKTAIPGAPPGVITSLRTLGDVRELLETNTDGTSPPPFDLESYVSQTVFMRPLLPQDHEPLYFAALEPQNSYRWRYRGQTISFREFSDSLSQGVLAQFAFASVADSSLVAYCSSYNYDPAAQHCAFAVQRLDFEDSADTAVVESAGLFLNYLFRTFNLRKVFADIPEYNMPAFGVLPDVFETEGTRRDYYWHAGRFWTEVTISTSRAAWQTFAAASFYR